MSVKDLTTTLTATVDKKKALEEQMHTILPLIRVLLKDSPEGSIQGAFIYILSCTDCGLNYTVLYGFSFSFFRFEKNHFTCVQLS